MEIIVKRKDLLGDFYNIKDCPLTRAIKRALKREDISVGTYSMGVGETFYPTVIPEYAWKKAQERSRSLKGFIKGGFKFTLNI